MSKRKILFSIIFVCIESFLILFITSDKYDFKTNIKKKGDYFSDSFGRENERSMQYSQEYTTTSNYITQMNTTTTILSYCTRNLIEEETTYEFDNEMKTSLDTTNTESVSTVMCESTEVIQEEQQTDVNDSETETMGEEIKDAIIIGEKVIDIFYGAASQENVDEHDVVQDTEYFSDYSSTFLFGHCYGSFSCLKSINVGDIIVLVNDGVERRFVVTRSEIAEVINDGYDFQSCSDGMRLVYNDFEYKNIRLVTCLEESPNLYRWVVIGQLIE